LSSETPPFPLNSRNLAVRRAGLGAAGGRIRSLLMSPSRSIRDDLSMINQG
jgi:hypothetical protein